MQKTANCLLFRVKTTEHNRTLRENMQTRVWQSSCCVQTRGKCQDTILLSIFCHFIQFLHYKYFITLVLICFCLIKGRGMLLLPETIAANFLPCFY